MRLEQLRNDPLAYPSTLQYPCFERRLEETNDNGVLLPSYVSTSETFSELCNSVFKGINENRDNTEWLTSRAVLVTKNVKLNDINEMVGSRIPGEPKTFRSADSVENNDLQAQFSAEIRYPQELLNQVDAGSSMPDHCLTLKKVILSCCYGTSERKKDMFMVLDMLMKK